MRYIATTVLVFSLLISSAFGQLESIQRLQEAQREIDATRETLHILETEYGRLDRRMLEPLDQFSHALIENERYTEAHDILDQAIQIIRVSEGLYSPSQFPLLVRIIENYINRGDWNSAKEIMEHLDWLSKRGENSINEELITTILDLIDIHLWGIADDFVMHQPYHFRRAESLTNFASGIARFSFEEGDDRIPSIIYKKVVQLYLQAVAVEVGGPTGISLRSYSSTGYAISRRDARTAIYYSGLRSLAGIRDFYFQPETPNLEGAGLTYFYIGDWEVLFGNPEAASRAYEQGINLLLAAEFSQESIDRLTAQPQMLPLTEFYGSMETAIAAIMESAVDNEGTSSNFSFRQWSSQFPKTIAPVHYGLEEMDIDDGDYAMFSFNLAGLDQVERWYRGRLKKKVSSPQDLELINRDMNSSVDWFELTESIKDFSYRPKMVGGEPQSVSATLYFQLAN
ncbi:MAG: hypothetical protein OXU66_05230 [Gammaproteobacteria bacterium]|nr:hypothetical protein [Gammaproteobacteria bacterium]